MKLLKNFDPSMSFWEANPVVNTVPEFEELKERLGKRKSSHVMWAIAFLLDKGEDNVWRNVSAQDCETLIKEDFLKDNSFTFSDYKRQTEAYKRHMMTPAQRSLLDWENKLRERSEFINDTAYDLDTIAKLDAAQKNTIEIFKVYEKIKEELEKENAEGQLRGGAQESATEKGLI